MSAQIVNVSVVIPHDTKINVICSGGEECLFTSLDLDRLCSEVMTAKSPCLVGTSDDAGRLIFFCLVFAETLTALENDLSAL